MIENIFTSDELSGLSRKMKRAFYTKSVPESEVQEYIDNGWERQLSIKKKTKAKKRRRKKRKTVRLKKMKRRDVFLEHRVWSLFHALKFEHLSGDGGAFLTIDDSNPKSPRSQIDVVAICPEVAIAVECKSAEKPKRNPAFKDEIAKLANHRRRFQQAINKQFDSKYKRKTILIIATWDLILSDNDIERARNENIVLINEELLSYYEQLAKHLGEAAKYHLFSEFMPDKRVQALEVKVPALKSKMGKYTCYNFSIKPSYLLKIAEVLHRARRRTADVSTYQRMIKKSRLAKIRKYISKGGVFPTNIVINLDKRHTSFELRKQEGGPEGAKYGTLLIKPAYGSAKIIDGQHRLYAYSGHPRADNSYLNVLAYEGLPESLQAQIFVDINHEQKSVPRSLLYELAGDLKKGAEEQKEQVESIVSNALQRLNDKLDSPLYDRIQLTHQEKSITRCVKLATIAHALKQHGMYIIKESKVYGPLWADNESRSIERTMKVVDAWLKEIAANVGDWWELGSGEGGGLAMTDGVTVCIGVLKSVFQHLGSKGLSLIELADNEIIEKLQPYAECLGKYLSSLTPEERLAFRQGARGVQGQTSRRRECEEAIHRFFPEFEPPGLKEDLALQAAETNIKAYDIIQRVEPMLRDIVVAKLKELYPNNNDWWHKGVHIEIRNKINKRIEEEEGRLEREDAFDIVDFKVIISKHWIAFRDLLAFESKRSKEAGTRWIVNLNDLRKVVMHRVKRRNINWDELTLLSQYEDWLTCVKESVA